MQQWVNLYSDNNILFLQGPEMTPLKQEEFKFDKASNTSKCLKEGMNSKKVIPPPPPQKSGLLSKTIIYSIYPSLLWNDECIYDLILLTWNP